MITPSHIIYSWALAKKTGKSGGAMPRHRTLSFILGALFPDTPTYLFFVVNGLILGYSGQVMWDDMYFNSAWSIPITLTHSLILWPFIIASATYFGWNHLRWFSISALIHTAIDFLVHTDDAYKHFWPLSDWKFLSPVSYWNPAEYGVYVSVFDIVLVIALLIFLYRHYLKQSSCWQRYVILLLGGLYSIKVVTEPVLMFLYNYGA